MSISWLISNHGATELDCVSMKYGHSLDMVLSHLQTTDWLMQTAGTDKPHKCKITVSHTDCHYSMHHIMHYNLLRLAPNNVYIRLVIYKSFRHEPSVQGAIFSTLALNDFADKPPFR